MLEDMKMRKIFAVKVLLWAIANIFFFDSIYRSCCVEEISSSFFSSKIIYSEYIQNNVLTDQSFQIIIFYYICKENCNSRETLHIYQQTKQKYSF